MGEYAIYKGRRVKIGTCEDMYYLRADQAHLVRPDRGSVDPVRDREHIRFRFPWPDEDGIEPGAFEDHNRSLTVWGVKPPKGLYHHSVQFKADNGYLLSLPCPESEIERAYVIHKNGYGGAVKLAQQRYVDDQLVAVCECGGCGTKWRLATIEDAQPIIDALREQGQAGIADRVEAGYGLNIVRTQGSELSL